MPRNLLTKLLSAAPAAAILAALTAPARADLAAEISSLVKAAGLRDAEISVSVRDPDSSSPLVAIHAERPMLPASNMKLLTSGAALHLLGPDFRFRTMMRLDHSGDGAVLAVIGDGDPAFGDPQLLAHTAWTDARGVRRVGMTPEELVGVWVNAVKAAGVESIREVVVDHRVFDREFFHPAWPAAQLNQRSFAESAGLTFQLNVLHFRPRPGGGPRPDVSDVRPRASWITVENRASARSGKADRHDVWLSRAANANHFVVKGNVKHAARDPIEVPLHDMPEFFAQLLADRLRDAGISVGAARTARPDEPPFGGEAIGPVVQTPLAAALERCNADSHNVYAENLLKRLGHAVTGAPGSWSNGAAAVRQAMRERLGSSLGESGLGAGTPATLEAVLAAIEVSDGSGLSRRNRVTAALLTAWLDTFHRDPRLGPMFVDSLAVGGVSGTLKSRFGALQGSGIVVQCKTGYINGVSCLSGYVTMPDGRRRSFSILGNNLVQPGAVAKAKRLQEAIVEAIAADLATASVLGGN